MVSVLWFESVLLAVLAYYSHHCSRTGSIQASPLSYKHSVITPEEEPEEDMIYCVWDEKYQCLRLASEKDSVAVMFGGKGFSVDELDAIIAKAIENASDDNA